MVDHDYYKNKNNTEEVVRDKAWYVASLIIVNVAEGYQSVFQKIGADKSYYEVAYFNPKKMDTMQVEMQIFWAGFADYAAKKVLSENLAKNFSDALIQKLAETMEKVELHFPAADYSALAGERFAWYAKENYGKEFKHHTMPSNETYKKICLDVLGTYNDHLYKLFEQTFTKIMLDLDFEGLLSMGAGTTIEDLTEDEQRSLKIFANNARTAEMAQAEDLIKNCNISFQFAKTHSAYVKDWEKTKRQMENKLAINSLPPNVSPRLFRAMINISEQIVQEKLEVIRNAFQKKFGESIYNYLGRDGKTKKLFGIFG